MGKKKTKKLKAMENYETKEQQVLLSWSCPPKGWYKLNVDGTVHTRIGGGGVIRDENGEWVGGFAANFGWGKPADAELSALHTGLEYACKSGWLPLEVETDAMKAVQFVMYVVKVDYNHPQFDMIRRCQALLNQNRRCFVRHVYREQNCVADSLARHGLTMERGCHYFTEPPPHCVPLLARDQSGFARPRFITPRAVQTRLNYLNMLKNQTVRTLIPKPYGFKNKYVRSVEEVKVEEWDALAPVTFTWKIDNFSKLDTASKHYSDIFVVNNSKWRIILHLKGNANDYFAPYLNVPDIEALPQGWSRCVQFSMTVVNQLQPSKSITKDVVHVFNASHSDCGFKFLVPLSWLSAHANEYLVNDICILEAKVILHKSKAKNLEDKRTVGYAHVGTSEEVLKDQGPDLESAKLQML